MRSFNGKIGGNFYNSHPSCNLRIGEIVYKSHPSWGLMMVGLVKFSINFIHLGFL